MADRARARVTLSRLREMGVHIALDDFGTGYSSLAYLRELPMDELKLGRSFVFPMADDARAAALVESTIRLAHSLGLRMVAEGVDDDATYSELSRYGCDQIQGFHVCPPLPAADLDDWLCQREALADLRQGLRPSGAARRQGGASGLRRQPSAGEPGPAAGQSGRSHRPPAQEPGMP